MNYNRHRLGVVGIQNNLIKTKLTITFQPCMRACVVGFLRSVSPLQRLRQAPHAHAATFPHPSSANQLYGTLYVQPVVLRKGISGPERESVFSGPEKEGLRTRATRTDLGPPATTSTCGSSDDLSLPCPVIERKTPLLGYRIYSNPII